MTQQVGSPQNFTGSLARVHAAAQRISHLKDELRAEYERRDQAVVQAIDEGHKYRAIARAAECTYSTVYKIMTDWA